MIPPIVVKFGSAALAPGAALDEARIAGFAAAAAALLREGHRLCIVSSGAIASGLEAMGLNAMPAAIVDRQAAAALGQPRLIAAWSAALEAHGVRAAQVLLTSDDFDHRGRFLNARRTIEALLAGAVVPIVNENDSVSFDEIRFGDNDRLAALVASLVGASRLVLVSTAPGLLDRDGRIVPLVNDLDAARPLVRDERSAVGTGGMTTKLDAAAIASSHAIETVLVGSDDADRVLRAARGEPIGTRITPDAVGPTARKSWIGFSLRIRGTIAVDDGAAHALRERGASLLPKGIVGVEGRFEAGAAVRVMDATGRPIARGLCAYSASEVRRLAGRATEEIESILGYRYSDEVVHRDDMVLERDAPTPAATEGRPT